MSQMSAALTSESKQYASKARDLHRQVREEVFVGSLLLACPPHMRAAVPAGPDPEVHACRGRAGISHADAVGAVILLGQEMIICLVCNVLCGIESITCR